jgi:hypothetical protein
MHLGAYVMSNTREVERQSPEIRAFGVKTSSDEKATELGEDLVNKILQDLIEIKRDLISYMQLVSAENSHLFSLFSERNVPPSGADTQAFFPQLQVVKRTVL